MKYLGCSIAGIAFLLDQFIKFMVRSNLHLYESIQIIPDFFRITYVENDGAAWNIFSGNKFLLVAIAIGVLIMMYEMVFKKKELSTPEQIGYSLFVGGVLGNLIDRILLGKVIDYLDFTLFGYAYPVFNLADICIVMSVVLLFIDALWGEKLWKKLK